MIKILSIVLAFSFTACKRDDLSPTADSGAGDLSHALKIAKRHVC